ncbi:MAG: NAD(P)H-dependent oxidoreductase [Actinomycetota bacterium]
MHAAVIVAHPNPVAYCHALARAAVSGLSAAGHEVDLVDLAASGFRAAMTPDERRAYHGDSPILDDEIAGHARLAQSVDTLVFVYPTWWGGLPAILKGWLDRVLVPGVGFVFSDDGKVRPGLTNVRRIIGVSTYGSPRSYVRVMTDSGRRTLTRTLRVSCGPKTSTRWFGLYSLDGTTEAERRAFADRVERAMAAL